MTKVVPFKKRPSTPKKKEIPKGNLLLAVLLLIGLSFAIAPLFFFSIMTYWILPKHVKERASDWYHETYGEGYRILQQIEAGEPQDEL